MFDLRLDQLKQKANGYWPSRIINQLQYAHELSLVDGGKYDVLVDQTIAFLVERSEKDTAVTETTARLAEDMIRSLSPAAKKYHVVCAAHAHIDMNWMWRWDETVAISLDTFRTMLNLMEEFPEFKFSQSQASVYQIVEQYAPEMLEEIRARIQTGRWEVTASTWVEADKNLPNGESHARHLLYTRRYLKKLLGLSDDDFQLDFEPDTFGHHAFVPEVLANGGVKFYYHCRGDNSHLLYRWTAPSGQSIVVYREPTWYLGAIEPEMALYAPSFCARYGMDTMLKVYGVGDHGGGPTRRDLEKIIDLNTWPVFPAVRFGTFRDFYSRVAAVENSLPEMTGELNFVFTGCYTSQSRIKRANRTAEAALYASEAYSALAALDKLPYPKEAFAAAWQNTLFNQFHDIIPGSGVIDTREYALGLFQRTMATATSQKSRAFSALTHQQQLVLNQKLEGGSSRLAASVSEGAGVGFGIEEYRISQVSRGGGKERLFHVFNPSPWPRSQVVEMVVWDWDGSLPRLVCQDAAGKILRHQVVDRGFNNYWGHLYLRILVEVTTPPCGYASVLLKESNAVLNDLSFPLDPRVELVDVFTLENEHMAAHFDSHSCALVSLVDKASGAELVKADRPAAFRRIQEDGRAGMTAWIVGRYMEVKNLTDRVRVIRSERGGPLQQSFTYEIPSAPSKITVTVSLAAGSKALEYAVEADWHEIGRPGEGVPQLNFILPAAYPAHSYRYDIPFGSIDRQPLAMDVPASSWGMVVPAADGPALQLVTSGNQGFRGDQNALALTLLRSSYDPDPYPELGIHRLKFAICVASSGITNRALGAAAFDYTHPLDVYSGAGSQPDQVSLLALDSSTVLLSCIKAPEDGAPEDGVSSELIIRLYEANGSQAQSELCFARPVLKAAWVDAHEMPAAEDSSLTITENLVRFTMPPYRQMTLRVELA
jgi:alpha-mannosidase